MIRSDAVTGYRVIIHLYPRIYQEPTFVLQTKVKLDAHFFSHKISIGPKNVQTQNNCQTQTCLKVDFFSTVGRTIAVMV